MGPLSYFDELPMAVTVCDAKGMILYMNHKSIQTFSKDGGASLIGKSLLDCHPEPARQKLLALLESQAANTYTIEKNGVHKMIHQTPWFEDGKYKGLIEFSFEIPSQVPHFIRG
jgi:transcriptional regulator with PAS, ATPase and Fis domain